jgi:hypothetical protein
MLRCTAPANAHICAYAALAEAPHALPVDLMLVFHCLVGIKAKL